MHLIPFYVVDLELAMQETRIMHTFDERDGLPAGSYGLLEFYCPDPACDCRRVMLNVVEEKHPNRFLASISYGFDRDDEMAGPFLDPLNPQSRHAEKLLQLVEDAVLSDSRYVARLERHYILVKQAASDQTHPAYQELQKVLSDDAEMFPLPQQQGKPRRVGRNAPCPCGSGKKHKQCCGRR
ncbi:MAG: SEC-C domain-containing protein [Anaerolineae bacterium]|nr:SEC-C domain-containing protein [Anaerolineae bacterium]